MTGWKYRGRLVSSEDILYIRELITADPHQSRRTLSKKLCEAWGWRQLNGALCDMICRGLLVMLDRAGQIRLPPVAYVRHNPLAARARPAPVWIDTTPIAGRLAEIQPLEFGQVRRTGDDPFVNIRMGRHPSLAH